MGLFFAGIGIYGLFLAKKHFLREYYLFTEISTKLRRKKKEFLYYIYNFKNVLWLPWFRNSNIFFVISHFHLDCSNPGIKYRNSNSSNISKLKTIDTYVPTTMYLHTSFNNQVFESYCYALQYVYRAVVRSFKILEWNFSHMKKNFYPSLEKLTGIF